MTHIRTALLAAALVLASQSPGRAEDIDLFVQPPGATAGLPNVLILVDNTANWSRTVAGQAIQINELAALRNTVSALAVDEETGAAKYRVGLMLFTETGNPNNNVDGGYVRAAVRDMTEDNKEIYEEMLRRLSENGDKSNGGKAGKTMAEVYQYYRGYDPVSGNGKVKTDFDGANLTASNTTGLNAQARAASNAVYDLPYNALPSVNGRPYRSPLVDGSCAGNYLIYISNGAAQDNTADNTRAADLLRAAATAAGISNATDTIQINPTGSQANVADEWARFMKKSPLDLTTYTVDVDRITTGQGPGWTALLQSMAAVSDGKYFSVTSGNGGAEIAAALGKIFSEIQSVDSVFASVSLPVSVNTEGTYLNQVYIGMFRPDADGFPRWTGNLKQYKLSLFNNGTELKTVDADGSPAINGRTGFITECARSYWTPLVADSYWAFRPQGGCTLNGINYDSSNTPDGKIVEKGAQAYVLRGSTTRTLRTCAADFAACSSAGGLVDFNTSISNLQSMLGASSTTERDKLVNWFRGLDADDENINAIRDTTTPAEMRPSAHGDVVHSRPTAINFGTDEEPKIVVFYAGNDGVLRAVNGNRSASIGSAAAGRELWAFVPPEFYGQIKRLRDNSTQISFAGNPTTTPTPLPKPYGMDGAIVANGNHVYVGMRRGGRALYAFDVRDIAADSPRAPTLLWKRGCPVNLRAGASADDTGCSGVENGVAWSQIGQTWAAPRVMKVGGYTDSTTSLPKPLLIFGGGYDPCEDADPASDTCKSSSKGRGVYLVDAATGAPQNYFPTDRPVVGDVFVIVDRNTGLAKWAYLADLGGNIYRISAANTVSGFAANNLPFGSVPPVGWAITKIASLGCATANANCGANRKFFFAPDVVERYGTYYLLVGSGDREKPLDDDYWPNAYNTENYFFMVKDRPLSGDWLTVENSTCGANVICFNSLLEITTEEDTLLTDVATKKGWALKLRNQDPRTGEEVDDGKGEQVVTSAITIYGNVTFSTHTPARPVAGSCTSNLGVARVYNVRYDTANATSGERRFARVAGDGLPPSPVAGLVEIDIDGDDDDDTSTMKTFPFVIGADGDSPLEAGLPTSPETTTQPKSLTYWYLEK